MDNLITIKLSDHHTITGAWVWGPNDGNVACVRLEDGTTMQGDYIEPLPGLLGKGDDAKVYE